MQLAEEVTSLSVSALLVMGFPVSGRKKTTNTQTDRETGRWPDGERVNNDKRLR